MENKKLLEEIAIMYDTRKELDSFGNKKARELFCELRKRLDDGEIRSAGPCEDG